MTLEYPHFRLPPEHAPALQALLEQSYPRFSAAEYQSRHRALAGLMAAAGVDHLLLVTMQYVGNAVAWATGWRGTTEALVLFSPVARPDDPAGGHEATMWVEYFNHLPLARAIAHDVDVRWGEEQGIAEVAAELTRRGARRIGVIGPLPGARWKQLESRFEMVALDRDYSRLRLLKSAEEITWLRLGAALSDAGMRALIADTRPGLDEHALVCSIEPAYVGLGGMTGIHFLGSTSMAAPTVCVPRQYPSRRIIQPGDFVFCELSAAWWDYSGQILRGFTVDAEPTSLYRDLHATALAAFQAITAKIAPGVRAGDLVAASGVIEANGFTTCDDLIHGYGGGYMQPILGSASRPSGHQSTAANLVLAENMCLVVQPNVITSDGKAGVQLGECIRVTATGWESLHALPHEMFRAGQRL